MPENYSFDDQCYELARHFFPNASEEKLNEVAQAIQDTIETFPDEED